MNNHLLDFDASEVFWKLETIGGASFPVLSRALRLLLLNAAYDHAYTKRPEEVNGVRQDIWANDFTDHPDILNFRAVWTVFLLRKFENKGLFLKPLIFDEIILQLYQPNSFGVTPHMDPKVYRNLICTVNLSGNCRFGICQDRQGKDSLILDTTPGTVTIVRAPGFNGSDARPFHFVDHVTGPRYTIGLRQKG